MTEEYKRQPLPEWSEVLAEKDLEIKMLRTRLEVDERHPYDGIYCRDETIRLQDAEITRLTAQNDFLANDRDGYIQLLTDQNTRLTAEVEQNAIDLEEYRRDVERLRSVTVVQETLIRRVEAENESLWAVIEILQAAMTAKKPIPMAFKKAIIEARAILLGEQA